MENRVRIGWATRVVILVGLCLATNSWRVGAQLPAVEPLNFFTNLSTRLLEHEFGVGLEAIQIYPTNEYTPAVHRLLQVTANLWETTVAPTNNLPTVFRPQFRVANNAVYLSTYVVVTNASQLDELPLLDLSASTNPPALIPESGDALIFGVPLVIGARKGLPNFNEFRAENYFYLERRIQLRKNTANQLIETNQFFVMSIAMPTGVEFWNSYTSGYTRPLSIFVTNLTTMTLTNDLGVSVSQTFLTGERFDTNYWPAFIQTAPVRSNFMVMLRTNIPCLPTIGYRPNLGSSGFVSPTNVSLLDTSQNLIMPRWGVRLTSHLHVMILDQESGGIIDYALLGGLDYYTNLTDAVSSPPIGTGDPFDLLWLTNDLPGNPNLLTGRRGVEMQVLISRGVQGGVDLNSGKWHSFGRFDPNDVANAVAQFNSFLFDLTTNQTASVPFTPIVQFYVPMVWQANDPMVHYLSDELFYLQGSLEPRYVNSTPFTGVMESIGMKNERYKPWPRVAVAPNPNNQDAVDNVSLSLKDPMLTASDEWNFPTNQSLSIRTIGQIHRGTPWQTIYLKPDAPNPMSWLKWSGHTTNVAERTTPLRDRPVVELLQLLLNTNPPQRLLSVNDLNSNNWLAAFDGIKVLTNVGPTGATARPMFEVVNIASNSPQAAFLADAIAVTRSTYPGQVFRSITDLLSVPGLTLGSPWLNPSTMYQQFRGLTDEAYEKIPSQLLSQVRADSIGTVVAEAGGLRLRFTGFDGYSYGVQSASQLADWHCVSTNYPTDGVFEFVVPMDSEKMFYRSILLP